MGDRSAIVIHSEQYKTPITFYGHWSGEQNIEAVKNVLARTGRVGDPSYLTAQIFYEFAIRLGNYDGMEFAADGTLLSEAKTFTAKRTDREETAEFRADIKESGFVDMFPVLYATAEVPERTWMSTMAKKIMTSEYHANDWPQLVALTKYPNHFCRSTGLPAYDNHKDALRALVASVTKNMTKFVDTDVTVL